MTRAASRRHLADRLLGAATFAVLTSASTPAAAQQPRALDRNPTDGVERVYHDYSGSGDASSLELNPALLSATQGLDLTLLGYQATSDFVRGTGFGAFASLNLRLGLALGFGAQFVRPRLGQDVFDFAQDENPAITKLSWAISSGMGEVGSFGVAIHGIRSGGDWIQRPDLDIGMLSRIYNYGSVGVVARMSPVDVRSEALPAHLSFIGEVAVRPLGTHHLELAGGVKYRALEAGPAEPLRELGLDGVFPRGRISVRYHGLAIKGEVEQVQTSVLDPNNFSFVRSEKAVRGSVALEAIWDFASVEGGVQAGVSDSLDGFGIKARLHTQRRGRVFWPRRVDAERLEIADIADERGLIEVLQRIERAREAGARSVLVVDTRGVKAGWASLHELREALRRVRDAGGHVFAYLEHANMRDYYLASVAEKIYIHPAGGLATYGLSSSTLYFAEALDKIGVNAEVIHVGEYKSAGEPFTQTGPSQADRAQRMELLRDQYGQIVYDVARARGLDGARVRALFDDAPHDPAKAVEVGLADEIVFRDELTGSISEDIGATVEFRDIPDTRPEDETWSKAPYIGVVLVEDTIIDGMSRRIPLFGIRFAGGDTISKTLRELREDRACRGIVLRVNSPGGSALASDIIWREVERTSKAHAEDPRSSPPIVVSMGDVAASGGYYVAMGSKHVLADPMTITGSIGVVSLHFDISGLLAKLGISTATFKEGKNPDIDSLYKPYSEEQRERMEAAIEQTYDLFRKRVANGRGMTMERVDELGRGHIYSGLDAKSLGLVDRLGGLHEAIALVREQANVPKFRHLQLRVVPRDRTLLDIILNTVDGPFEGAVARTKARRRARKDGSFLRDVVPLALNEALAKLPLSILYLPQDRTHTLTRWLPD